MNTEHPPFQLELATSHHADGIAEIYNHEVVHGTATFDWDPWNRAETLRWIDDHGAPNLGMVAVERGASGPSSVLGFAGYGMLHTRDGYAHTRETTIYVRPEARRRGVAVVLYRELISRARAGGIRQLVAILGGDNPGSEAFHERLGFVHQGTLRSVGRKFDRWLDAHYWQLSIEPETAGAATGLPK